LKANKITAGNTNGTFTPAASLSRQAMAAFLYRLATKGGTAPACATAPFSDVPTSNPFCGDIAWLKINRISTGNANGTFTPAASISRQAMAAFLYRLGNDGGTAPGCETAPFSDVPTSSPFCGDITWLKTNQISTGNTDGTFAPAAAISRGAIAAFLHRDSDAALTGPTVVTFVNCSAMRVTYPHGVGLPGAIDQTSGTPVTQFLVSRELYNANTKSDADHDGIACEAP
jgi:hypothetical protein